MSYTIEKMADQPAVLVHLNADFDSQADLWPAVEQSTELIIEQNAPTFSVWDTRQIITTVDGIVQGANVGRSFDIPANQRGIIVISTEPAIKMAMEGMNTRAFGHMEISVFEDLDEALAYIHQQLDNPN